MIKYKVAIVTGANGFLGNALINKLVESYDKIYAIVRDKKENMDQLKKWSNVIIIVCDLSKIFLLKDMIQEKEIDTFFHFAWMGTNGIRRNSYEIQIANIKYSCEAIKLAKEINCKRFLFAASIMEYECIEAMNLTMPVVPGNIYSTSKLAAHFMTRILADQFNIKYNAAIISNVYGVGEKSQRLINNTIIKLLNKEETAFTSADQIYDFIYIDDAIDAINTIVEKGIANKNYYIGSLNPRPLKLFLLDIKDCINPNIVLGIGKIQSNGNCLDYSKFDIYALKKDTGFVPKYDFKEGIKETIKWLSKFY